MPTPTTDKPRARAIYKEFYSVLKGKIGSSHSLVSPTSANSNKFEKRAEALAKLKILESYGSDLISSPSARTDLKVSQVDFPPTPNSVSLQSSAYANTNAKFLATQAEGRARPLLAPAQNPAGATREGYFAPNAPVQRRLSRLSQPNQVPKISEPAQSRLESHFGYYLDPPEKRVSLPLRESPRRLPQPLSPTRPIDANPLLYERTQSCDYDSDESSSCSRLQHQDRLVLPPDNEPKSLSTPQPCSSNYREDPRISVRRPDTGYPHEELNYVIHQLKQCVDATVARIQTKQQCEKHALRAMSYSFWYVLNDHWDDEGIRKPVLRSSQKTEQYVKAYVYGECPVLPRTNLEYCKMLGLMMEVCDCMSLKMGLTKELKAQWRRRYPGREEVSTDSGDEALYAEYLEDYSVSKSDLDTAAPVEISRRF